MKLEKLVSLQDNKDEKWEVKKLEDISKKEYKLSSDQECALFDIKNWIDRDIKKSEDCFFSLTGSAGTGKTTLVSRLVSDLKEKYRSKICVSAPTHKAKRVITEKSGCDQSETVQALLGLKPDLDIENFDINNPVFSAISKKKMAGYKLLLIDESSMINNDLFAIICEDAVRYGVKTIFIGDELQLPPIKEFSQALSSPVNRYRLEEVIRQENTNSLLILLNILRDDIVNNTSNYVSFLENHPLNMNEKEGYSVLSAERFGLELTRSYESIEYQNDRNYVRYLSWTNESIQSANKYIRKSIINLNEPITKGELMLGYRTVIKDYNDTIIQNSEDYITGDSEVSEDKRGIRVITTSIKSLDNDESKEKIINIVYPDNKNYELYLSERYHLLDTAIRLKGKNWKNYYGFRNSYTLLDNLYDRTTLLDKKDIDYGYGITVHKSQGSTYNTVFVNVKNINLNKDPIEKKKLLYVALSRASNKVYINL